MLVRLDAALDTRSLHRWHPVLHVLLVLARRVLLPLPLLRLLKLKLLPLSTCRCRCHCCRAPRRPSRQGWEGRRG